MNEIVHKPKTLDRLLLASLERLAEAGEVEAACRLAGEACAALRPYDARATQRFNALLHRLTRPATATRSPRNSDIGPPVDIPQQLPVGYVFYARSPEFTSEALPDALRSGHATKLGVWGLLCVTEGALRYSLEPPREGEAIVRAGETLVIETAVRHHVQFIEPGRFHVEFYRAS